MTRPKMIAATAMIVANLFSAPSFAGTCSYSDSESSQKISLILSASHRVPVILDEARKILAELGYERVYLTSLRSCSNDNSDGIDYELLRAAVIKAFTDR